MTLGEEHLQIIVALFLAVLSYIKIKEIKNHDTRMIKSNKSPNFPTISSSALDQMLDSDKNSNLFHSEMQVAEYLNVSSAKRRKMIKQSSPFFDGIEVDAVDEMEGIINQNGIEQMQMQMKMRDNQQQSPFAKEREERTATSIRQKSVIVSQLPFDLKFENIPSFCEDAFDPKFENIPDAQSKSKTKPICKKQKNWKKWRNWLKKVMLKNK